jgi:tetrahydromethanopterin S-methyltransferase subunit B
MTDPPVTGGGRHSTPTTRFVLAAGMLSAFMFGMLAGLVIAALLLGPS